MLKIKDIRKPMNQKLCIECGKEKVFIKKRGLGISCYNRLKARGLLFKSKRDSNKDRNESLVRKYGAEILQDFKDLNKKQRWNLTDIGKKYGFSREYARQIYNRLYGKPYRSVRSAKTKGYK